MSLPFIAVMAQPGVPASTAVSHRPATQAEAAFCRSGPPERAGRAGWTVTATQNHGGQQARRVRPCAGVVAAAWLPLDTSLGGSPATWPTMRRARPCISKTKAKRQRFTTLPVAWQRLPFLGLQGAPDGPGGMSLPPRGHGGQQARRVRVCAGIVAAAFLPRGWEAAKPVFIGANRAEDEREP